jgi:hypothetical protein
MNKFYAFTVGFNVGTILIVLMTLNVDIIEDSTEPIIIEDPGFTRWDVVKQATQMTRAAADDAT